MATTMVPKPITKENYLRVREEVMRRGRSGSPEARRRGVAREAKTKRVLEAMRCEGLIADFMATGAYSYADLQGIDFFVIVIRNGRREARKLSVTGPRWVARKEFLHPGIAVVGIEPEEEDERVRIKITRALRI